MSQYILDQVKCGSCGHDQFTISTLRAIDSTRLGSGPFNGDLRVTCLGCKEVSSIYIIPPSLDVRGLDNAMGSICGGY